MQRIELGRMPIRLRPSATVRAGYDEAGEMVFLRATTADGSNRMQRSELDRWMAPSAPVGNRTGSLRRIGRNGFHASDNCGREQSDAAK